MLKYSDIDESRVNGTLIWYYKICPREVWLIAHSLEADQDNELLEIGRLIHETSYERKTKEVSIGNMKVDLIGKQGERVVIGEIKKSSRYMESAKLQLAFYLLALEDRGIDAIGYIQFPKEMTKIQVDLSEAIRDELEQCIKGINRIITLDKPPKAEEIQYCRKCAYQEFCWA